MKKFIILILLLLGVILFVKPTQISAQTQGCSTPPTDTGKVTLSATATDGTYRVWARIKAPDITNNSFYFQINNCAVLMGNSTSIPTNTWTWIDYRDGSSTNKVNTTLTAGTHVVTLIGNENGVGVDKILMTKDLNCIPTGTSGDNCPAEISASPTLTKAPAPTTAPNDTTPPIISNPRVEEVNANSAKFLWELNEFASGQVEYRTSGASTWTKTSLQTCCTYNYHIQSVTGLTPGTSSNTYEYRITSTDASGNTAVSPVCTFILGGTATQNCNLNPTPTTTPAPTKTPTPTPISNSTVLRFQKVFLHGIGKGGDNTKPTSTGTSNPLRTTRSLTVELIDSFGNTLPSLTGNITYQGSTLGYFAGDITLPSSISTGSYLIKVKSPQYLKKQVLGIVSITKGGVTIIPQISLTTGDTNNNNSLTTTDFNIITDCYSDLLPAKNCADSAKKQAADLTDDGKVNQADYNLFLRELSVLAGD